MKGHFIELNIGVVNTRSRGYSVLRAAPRRHAMALETSSRASTLPSVTACASVRDLPGVPDLKNLFREVDIAF
jgi:hypothetical protein